MRIGLIGLGKMGYNLALNLQSKAIEVVGYDASLESVQRLQEAGIQAEKEFSAFMASLSSPRIIWIMVPAGDITNRVIEKVSAYAQAGDIVIDGGNSHFEDSKRNATELKAKGIHFLDVGSSGGTSGARHGLCLMVGGEQSVYHQLEPVFEAITVDGGCLYTGPSGSGHFLKMVHNGIEYGMMQAIGEGFEVLEASEYDFDFPRVAHVWNHGSVIRSWLMELAEGAFIKDPKLNDLIGSVDASGEAQWTVETALKYQVPTPVISLSLMMRYRSKQEDTFSGKVVAALRNAFGGHAVKSK